MEMVEINPMLDNDGATMLLANRIVREVLVGMALRKKGITDPKYVDPDFITHSNQ
jgi:agmatinase